MKKTLLVLLLTAVVAIGLAAPSFAADKKICKLGHVNSPASIFQYGAEAFKTAVEKELPDWTIELYPAGQLGGSLAMIQGLQQIDLGQLMAGSSIAALPVIIVFLFFQRQITEGITKGAIKG